MKKPILVFALSLIAGGALVACNAERIPDLPAEEVTAQDELTPSQVFNIQAVTGLSMVHPVVSSSISPLSAHNTFNEDEIAIIQDALPTIDLILDNGALFSSVVQVVNLEVDGATYKYEEAITYLTSDLVESSFRLLYNIEGEVEEEKTPAESEEVTESTEEIVKETEEVVETPEESVEDSVEEETSSAEESIITKGWNGSHHNYENSSEEEETEPAEETKREEGHGWEHDNEREHEDDHGHGHERDEDEIKSTSTLNGIAYLDEESYVPFYSHVETEIDDDETTTERHFRLQTGENSQINIHEEREIEDDEEEHELSYTVTENGRLMTSYKLDMETSENKDEITLKTNHEKYRVIRIDNEDGTFYRVSVKGQGNKLVATFQKEIDEEGNVSYNVI